MISHPVTPSPQTTPDTIPSKKTSSTSRRMGFLFSLSVRNRPVPLGCHCSDSRSIKLGDSAYSFTPQLPTTVTDLLIQARLKALARLDQFLQRPQAPPQADLQPGQECCPLGRRLALGRLDHGNAEQIGLELQEVSVARHAAVDLKICKRETAVLAGGVEQIGHLQGDSFQRPAGQILTACRVKQAEYGTEGLRHPV